MARSKRKKKSANSVLVILILIVLIGIAGILGYRSVANYNKVCNPNDTSMYSITVTPGMSSNSISKMLEENGIIENAKRFSLRARINHYDQKFMAGDYQLSPSMSTDEIYYALQNATREEVTFTIPEGYYIRQVAAKLVKDGLIASEQDFYDACEDDYDYDFIPSEKECVSDPTGTLSPRANRLEGYLFPNTYNVFKGASAHDIINRMLQGFKSVSEELSIDKQTIIIASLIERETKVASERELVSSVIQNRLNDGMKLQFCSSVQYSLGENKTRLLYADLDIDTPYNTYMYEGLPKGPIASPGKASIEAALNPANTEYLFFVLKGDGSGAHNFAKSSSEFANYKKDYLNAID